MKTGTLAVIHMTAFILLFGPVQLDAQQDTAVVDPDDPSGTIEVQLTAELQNALGSQYTLGFQVLDSTIARNVGTSRNSVLSDPYGTLKGCVLFGADQTEAADNEHGVIGIFKSGQIIWHSDPIFKGIWGGTFSITDVNNDGKVDLLVEWTPGAQMFLVRHLWIISWDGTTGTIINQIDPATGNTTIHADESMFELIPEDTVSAMAIRARWPDEEDFFKWFPGTQISTLPYVTYTWNGTQYGFWPSARQIASETFLPANLLDAPIHCSVVGQNDSLSYHYSVFNSPRSQQSLSVIALKGVHSPFFNRNQSSWDFWGYSSDRSLAMWVAHNGEKESAISPSQGIMLDVESLGLPSIVDYYAQGLRPMPHLNPANANPGWVTNFLSDLFSNSFHRSTVGPTDPPNPFSAANFLDTITDYAAQCRFLGWIKDQGTADKYVNYFNTAKSNLQQNNITGVRTTLNQVLTDVNIDSTSNLTSEAYALIRFNTEYLLSQSPSAPPSGLAVRLINRSGENLKGGSLQYYQGAWKGAVNNGDGTFTVNTNQSNVSLRMTYAYGSQQKNNVPVSGSSVTFQTVNTQVNLQNSQGTAMDTGTVQYYAGAWRTLGTTSNGTASMELLPATYSFRMTYAGGSNDKQQDIGTNSTVVFQTVNAAVQLENSQGTPMDQGTVQYYAGAWRDFGKTTNGVATKELLPANYSFRMTYAYASKDEQQNIGTNPMVVFNTINTTVELRNSLDNLIDQGTVQYYAGAWRSLGTTANGVASKELLPNSYSFRMTYEYVSNDKQQDIGTNSTVSFSTVLCTVRVANALGQLVSGAVVSYYSGAWRQIGTTVNGVITKELLPATLSFRMSYGGKPQDKQQNLLTNPVVEFVAP